MQRVIKYIKDIFAGEFAKNVATLLSGSTIAQIIPFIVAPILSRIFTPIEFGVLAVYLSVVNIIGSISTGKYELALVLPKEKRDVYNIFILGLFIVLASSIFVLVLLLLFKNLLIDWFNIERIARWIYLVPVSTFLVGLNNLLNYYNTKLKQFKTIAKSNIFKSASRSSMQLGSAYLSYGAGGLVVSEIIAFTIGNISYLKPVVKEIKTQEVSRSRIKYLAEKYKRFPMFSMWAVFFNTISQNVSNFFITSLFSLTQTGYFSYAMKYISIPINMMGNALGQVLMQQASESRNNVGNARIEYIAILKKLIAIGIPSFTLLYFIVEPVFAWYFGEEWRIAGQYAKILIPYFFARSIAMPLSILNSVFEKQLLSLYWQAGLFILTVGIFLFVKINSMSLVEYLSLFSIILSIYYGILVILLYFVASGGMNKKYF